MSPAAPLTAAVASGSGSDVQYVYDADGRLLATAVMGGQIAVYHYDAAGNVVSIDRRPAGPTAVLAVGPSSARVGDVVTVRGIGFSSDPAQDTVKFNGTTATVQFAAATSLTVTVPPGATSGLVTVTDPAGAATSPTPFTVTSGSLAVSSVSPNVVFPSTAVTVTGSGFSTTANDNAVRMLGIYGQVTSASATSMSVTASPFSPQPASPLAGHVEVAANGDQTVSGDVVFMPGSPTTASDVAYTGVQSANGVGATYQPPAAFGYHSYGAGLVAVDLARGQRVSVRLSTTSQFIACASFAVFAPDGSTVATMDCPGGSKPAFLDPFVAPMQGTYVLDVEGPASDNPVTLTAWTVPDDATVTAQPARADVTGVAPTVQVTTSVPGQRAEVRFHGSAGQIVFAAVDGCSTADSFLSADGTPVAPADDPLGCQTGAISEPGGSVAAQYTYATTLQLPADGDYLLLVDPIADATGTWTVHLYDVPADAVAAAPTDGSGVDVSTSSTGQRARVDFTVTAGQRVFVEADGYTASDATAGTVPCRAVLSVRKEQASAISHETRTFCNAPGPDPTDPRPLYTYVDTTTLATAGSYSAYLDPIGTQTGSWQLHIYTVPADAQPSITADGSSTPVTLSVGQNAQLSFTGTAGQRVSLETWIDTPDTLRAATVGISGPSGTTVAANHPVPSSGTPNDFIDTVTLPATGTYTVNFDPTSHSYGTAHFNLFTVVDRADTLTLDGPSVVDTLSTPGQNGTVSMAVHANQPIFINAPHNFDSSAGAPAGITSGSHSCGLAIRITNSTGGTVTTNTCWPANGYLDKYTPTADDTYTISVDPQRAATGTVTFTANTVPADATTTATVNGPPVTISNTAPGQNMRVQFAANSSQTIAATYSDNAGTGNCVVRLTWLAPDGSTYGPSASTCGAITPLSQPAAGTYTLLIDPVGPATVTSTVQLRDAANPLGALTANTAARLTHFLAADDPSEPRFQPGDHASGAAPTAGTSQTPTQVYDTTLRGVVRDYNNDGLANVTIRVDDHAVRTDQDGQFTLRGAYPGHHELIIDGRSAHRPGVTYGVFVAAVNIDPHGVTWLPATIWMPALDTAHEVTIPSPTTSEVTLTTPAIPGLEVHIPAGVVIRDVDGNLVHHVGITAIPLNKPPVPLPSGVQVPIFYTIQPGGAILCSVEQDADGECDLRHAETATSGTGPDAAEYAASGARLVYPNYTHLAPNTRVAFWHYEIGRNGWWPYGEGTVRPDGHQVEPDQGVAIHSFTGAMISGNGFLAALFGPLGRFFGGDPVDLQTGLLVYQHTDLEESDTIPLVLQRTFRQSDTVNRPFGIGSSDPFEIGLTSKSQYTECDVNLPDGGQIHYVRTSAGTGYTDAVFEAQTSPGPFYKSRIAWNGDGWTLTTRTGMTYVWGSERPLQSISDRYGNTIQIVRQYGTPGNYYGNITAVVSPHGRWLAFSYDASNRITQVSDTLGRTVSYTYNPAGRLATETDPAGGVTHYNYDANGNLTSVIDPGNITYLTSSYDANNRVSQQTLADTGSYHFAYTLDGSGNVTQTLVTDPRGLQQQTTFNAAGYPTADTTAYGTSLAQTTSYTRDPASNLITEITDARRRKTDYGYDSTGNLTSVTDLAGTAQARSTSVTYTNTFNQPAQITDPAGRVTTNSYDTAGNLIRSVDNAGNISRATYNGQGLVTASTDPTGHTTHYEYDGGDLTAIIDSLGRTTTRAFDAAGRVYRITNPTGETTTITYDALNHPTQISDSLGNTISYHYDPNGYLTDSYDQRGGHTHYTHDGQGRVTAITDPDGNTSTVTYDGDGNPSVITDGRGMVSDRDYDALNRLTRVGYGRTGASAPYSYQSQRSFSYDTGNRITGITDTSSGAGTISYTYNDRNDLTSETTGAGTITYTYNDDGQRTSMTPSGISPVNYGYDTAGRLTSVNQGSTTVNLTVDADGRTTRVSLPGGTASYQYDLAGQLTAINYTTPSGNPLGDLAYNYDAAARRVEMTGSWSRSNLPVAQGTASFDADNRLTALAGQSLAYDGDGNLTNDGTNAFSWNARGQLSSITGPSTAAAFTYDPVGRRIGATVNGTTTGYRYDAADTLAELTSPTGSPTATYLRGLGVDDAFTRTDSTGQSSFLKDALGSTLALTDNTGTIQTSYTYDPDGTPTLTGGTTTNPVTFTGRETGGLPDSLQYNRDRYYSPSLHRFISPDPLGITNTATNLYSYANNSPTNYTDPSGDDPIGGCIAGGIIGFGAAFFGGHKSFGDSLGWGLTGCAAGALFSTGLGALADSGALDWATTRIGALDFASDEGAIGVGSEGAADGAAAEMDAETLTTAGGKTIEVPDSYVARPSRTGGGTIYAPADNAPGDLSNAIRVMPANAQYPDGYVIEYDQYGHPVDANGNVPRTRGDYHQPLAPGQ